jgi:hypothetical protein
MDWKRRHTAGVILLGVSYVGMSASRGDFRLLETLIGAGVASVFWVWAISAPVQWAVRKYRGGDDDEPGDPPMPEAAD